MDEHFIVTLDRQTALLMRLAAEEAGLLMDSAASVLLTHLFRRLSIREIAGVLGHQGEDRTRVQERSGDG